MINPNYITNLRASFSVHICTHIHTVTHQTWKETHSMVINGHHGEENGRDAFHFIINNPVSLNSSQCACINVLLFKEKNVSNSEDYCEVFTK